MVDLGIVDDEYFWIKQGQLLLPSTPAWCCGACQLTVRRNAGEARRMCPLCTRGMVPAAVTIEVEEAVSTPLYVLREHLGTRIYNALLRAGINSVEALSGLEASTLERQSKLIGAQSIARIRRALALYPAIVQENTLQPPDE